MGALKIRLPHFVRLLQREGNIVAELFALSADVTAICHVLIPQITSLSYQIC